MVLMHEMHLVWNLNGDVGCLQTSVRSVERAEAEEEKTNSAAEICANLVTI